MDILIYLDPIVGGVQRVAASLERFAAGRGAWLVGLASALVIGSILITVLRRYAAGRERYGRL